MIVASSQPPPNDGQFPRLKKKDDTTSSFSPTTVNSANNLPSIGLAYPVHYLHLKLTSGFRGPGMQLHLFWTQQEHSPQKMEFVPTPLRHNARGVFWSTSSTGPDIRTLVFPMLPVAIFRTSNKNLFKTIGISLRIPCDRTPSSVIENYGIWSI